jgi:hypothetical protein
VISRGDGCPECFKPFAKTRNVVLPSGNAKDFFLSVNISKSGQITQDELACWISSYFDIDQGGAMGFVSDNWERWDTETRGMIKKSLLRMKAKDGVLDEKEFRAVQEYLAFLDRSARVETVSGVRATRPRDDDGFATEPPARRQRKESTQYLKDRMQTAGLLSRLKQGDGSSWFRFFDTDGSGKLSKDEVFNAMEQTLKGNNIAEDEAKSIVQGIWAIIDANGSGEIEQGFEFNTLRDMLIESTTPRGW